MLTQDIPSPLILYSGFTCVAVSRPQGRAFTRVIRSGSDDRVQVRAFEGNRTFAVLFRRQLNG